MIIKNENKSNYKTDFWDNFTEKKCQKMRKNYNIEIITKMTT
jgi:hypothetical protein